MAHMMTTRQSLIIVGMKGNNDKRQPPRFAVGCTQWCAPDMGVN
jgi:hypothetical protein